MSNNSVLERAIEGTRRQGPGFAYFAGRSGSAAARSAIRCNPVVRPSFAYAPLASSSVPYAISYRHLVKYRDEIAPIRLLVIAHHH